MNEQPSLVDPRERDMFADIKSLERSIATKKVELEKAQLNVHRFLKYPGHRELVATLKRDIEKLNQELELLKNKLAKYRELKGQRREDDHLELQKKITFLELKKKRDNN